MTNKRAGSVLGELLNARSLATPLHDALGQLARLGEQRDAHIAALERRCEDLSHRLDAQQTLAAQQKTSLLDRLDEQARQAAQREATLLSRIEALEEMRRADEALQPQEGFSPTLRARLVYPNTSPARLDDFVLVDLPTTPFGSLFNEPLRNSREPLQQVANVPTVFAIQRTPLVWSQWARVCGKQTAYGGALSTPVFGVSVWEMLEFCNELSAFDELQPCYELEYTTERHPHLVRFKGLDATGYRLPLEVEWEAAARAGEAGLRYGELAQIAWYSGNSGNRIHAVGQLQPNKLGLYDVLGNVREVVWGDIRRGTDIPGKRNITSVQDNSLLSCGGSCLSSSDRIRFSERTSSMISNTSPDHGVRLVRTVEVRDVSQTRE